MRELIEGLQRRSRAAGRLDGDGGAVIVEFALVLPILLTFSLGIIDFGNAYRQENIGQQVVMSAARTDSQQSKGRFADYEALRNISSGASAMANTVVKEVVVWKANTLITPQCTGTNPTGTTVKGTAGLCNIYSVTQVNEPNPGVGFPAGASNSLSCNGGWDSNWCPLTRNNADGAGDYLGIYVAFEYSSFTKIIASGKQKISEYAIYRLEPAFVGG